MSKNSEYVKKSVKKNCDRIAFTVPKGEKEQIRKHAELQGETLTAFIKRAIKQTMEDDGWK